MSSSTSFPIPNSSKEMPQDLARHLFDRGATLIFLNIPSGSEFGVDYKSWTVGDRFKGLKMIPPGVHFVYFSIGKAPRIGFFHEFKEKEILIRKWDAKTEDLLVENVDPEEVSTYRSNLRSLDPCLGPYPFESYRSWFALSSHVNGRLVERLSPAEGNGRISSQAELVTMETEMMETNADNPTTSHINTVDREHPSRIRFVDEQGLPLMRIRPGYDIRFHEIPQREISDVSTRTTNSMDSSDQLERLLNDLINEKELLGEMQFAFVVFLMGQVYEGFEHWKKLVHLFCSCSQSLISHRALFLEFLMTLHFQLKECPEDFFVDIVSRNNFLTVTLASLFSNIQTTEGVDAILREKSLKFKNYLTKRFRWDFESDESPTLVSSQ